MIPFDKTALAISCALIPLSASAAEAVTQLEAVTVTAKGYASDALETPHALTVIGAGDIAESGAANPGALLRGQAGLAVASDGAWGENPVIRGLKKEHIVVMVDGVRVNSAQPQGAIASMADTGLLEHAEVVKGPVSVLYGSGAMGGVVNFITPQPRFADKAQARGSLSAGLQSVNNGKEADAGLALSGPSHALNLGLASRDYGDYDAPGGKVVRTGFSRQSANLNYAFKLDERQTLRLNLQEQRDDDVWYPGSAKFANARIGTNTIHSPEQRRSLASAVWETRLGGAAAPTVTVNVHRQEVERRINAYSSVLQRDTVRNTVTFATYGGSARVQFAPRADHLLLAGIDGWVMKGDPERYSDTNAPAFNNNLRTDPFDQAEIRSAGVFVQDEIFFDQWKATLGARYDRVSGTARQMGVGAAAKTGGLDHDDNALSWSLGAIHNASHFFNPYFNVARAFRAADMRERFEDSARGDGYYTLGNPQLKPEISTTAEIGVKGQLAANRYAVALYRTEIRDYIAGRITGTINAATGLPVKVTENLAKVTITGLESEFEHRIAAGDWYARAALTLQRGDNRSDDEPLYQMPPHELALGLAWRPQSPWSAWLRLRAVSRQDRIATKFSNGTENATAGFATLDLGGAYRIGKNAVVRVAANNLLDRGYHEHLTEGVSGQEIQMPGRNFTLNLKGMF
jgi:hemoglobin/transferrin/lactoferrin receptor protein